MSNNFNKNNINSKKINMIITYVISSLIPIILILFSIVFVYQIERLEVILTFIICGTISFIAGMIYNLILIDKYYQINNKNELNSYDKALTKVINKICGGKENE